MNATDHPLADAHELFRIRIRQRLQEHAVDDAEHRRVRADAQGKRGEHRQREGALPSEHADCVADVPEELGQDGIVPLELAQGLNRTRGAKAPLSSRPPMSGRGTFRSPVSKSRSRPSGTSVAVVVLILAAVSSAATIVPARRAARVDPMLTLRVD